MAQQTNSSSQPLYPPLEATIAPLEQDDKYFKIMSIEKELVAHLHVMVNEEDVLANLEDRSVMPDELLTEARRIVKQKVDPVKALIEAGAEEVEEEEEAEDEDEEDEEAAEDDEEDDAGGDYLISHFDNGEGYEDNDDEGEDNTSMI